MRAAVALVLCLSACGSSDPVGTEIEVVSVDPRLLPASATDVSILFRVTRAGAVRVEANLEEADPVVARVDPVTAGGLFSVRVPLADFGPGSHLVTLVLAPATGEPPAEAEASFMIAESPEPEEDGGVPGPDSGVPPCEDGCAGQARSPVCGADFVTYDNECLLACAGVGKLFDGDCNDSSGDCVEECMDAGFDMVCGDDGVTYLNPCQMQCEGAEESHPGPCFGGF